MAVESTGTTAATANMATAPVDAAAASECGAEGSYAAGSVIIARKSVRALASCWMERDWTCDTAPTAVLERAARSPRGRKRSRAELCSPAQPTPERAAPASAAVAGPDMLVEVDSDNSHQLLAAAVAECVARVALAVQRWNATEREPGCQLVWVNEQLHPCPCELLVVDAATAGSTTPSVLCSVCIKRAGSGDEGDAALAVSCAPPAAAAAFSAIVEALREQWA